VVRHSMTRVHDSTCYHLAEHWRVAEKKKAPLAPTNTYRFPKHHATSRLGTTFRRRAEQDYIARRITGRLWDFPLRVSHGENAPLPRTHGYRPTQHLPTLPHHTTTPPQRTCHPLPTAYFAMQPGACLAFSMPHLVQPVAPLCADTTAAPFRTSPLTQSVPPNTVPDFSFPPPLLPPSMTTLCFVCFRTTGYPSYPPYQLFLCPPLLHFFASTLPGAGQDLPGSAAFHARRSIRRATTAPEPRQMNTGQGRWRGGTGIRHHYLSCLGVKLSVSYTRSLYALPGRDRFGEEEGRGKAVAGAKTGHPNHRLVGSGISLYSKQDTDLGMAYTSNVACRHFSPSLSAGGLGTDAGGMAGLGGAGAFLTSPSTLHGRQTLVLAHRLTRRLLSPYVTDLVLMNVHEPRL